MRPILGARALHGSAERACLQSTMGVCHRAFVDMTAATAVVVVVALFLLPPRAHAQNILSSGSYTSCTQVGTTLNCSQIDVQIVRDEDTGDVLLSTNCRSVSEFDLRDTAIGSRPISRTWITIDVPLKPWARPTPFEYYAPWSYYHNIEEPVGARNSTSQPLFN